MGLAPYGEPFRKVTEISTKPLPASEGSKPSYQLRWAGEAHAITPAERRGTTLRPSVNSPATLPEQMPHQPCCSRVLTKQLCQEVRTSPPTPLTLASSCTFRSRSCSWSCSIESDISVHAEVGTRGLGERHTGREEPCEDRPTRQDRPGCPDQDGCSFIQSSPYNPKHRDP